MARGTILQLISTSEENNTIYACDKNIVSVNSNNICIIGLASDTVIIDGISFSASIDISKIVSITVNYTYSKVKIPFDLAVNISSGKIAEIDGCVIQYVRFKNIFFGTSCNKNRPNSPLQIPMISKYKSCTDENIKIHISSSEDFDYDVFYTRVFYDSHIHNMIFNDKFGETYSNNYHEMIYTINSDNICSNFFVNATCQNFVYVSLNFEPIRITYNSTTLVDYDKKKNNEMNFYTIVIPTPDTGVKYREYYITLYFPPNFIESIKYSTAYLRYFGLCTN
jgi:hypothetical protein